MSWDSNLCPEAVTILSHRIRGFAPREMSREGLERAIAEGVRMIEVDTRHTRDDQIVLHHDSHFPRWPAGTPIATLTLAELRTRGRQLSPPLDPMTFEELITRLEPERMRLTIDLKDGDLLERYASIICGSSMKPRICITSWIPQALVDFHRICPDVALNFSHVSLIGWPLPAMAGLQLVRRLLAPLNLLGRVIRARVFVDYENRPLDSWARRGMNDIHLLTRPPEGVLLHALQNSRGGIGVFVKSINPTRMAAWADLGLEVRAFSIRRESELRRFRRVGFPLIIFSDNPRLVSRWSNRSSS